jgi:hypothetical protein
MWFRVILGVLRAGSRLCVRDDHLVVMVVRLGVRASYAPSSNVSNPGADGFFTLIHDFDGPDRLAGLISVAHFW